MYVFSDQFGILVYLGGSWNGKCWYILKPFGIVCIDLIFFRVLLCLSQEKSGNPATGSSKMKYKTQRVTNLASLIFFAVYRNQPPFVLSSV
jgi:hypothetical protein